MKKKNSNKIYFISIDESNFLPYPLQCALIHIFVAILSIVSSQHRRSIVLVDEINFSIYFRDFSQFPLFYWVRLVVVCMCALRFLVHQSHLRETYISIVFYVELINCLVQSNNDI